jgi:cysteinyl-tRNA synthetase
MQASNETGKVGGRATREIAEGDQATQEAGKLGKSKGAAPFSELLSRHAPETIRFFLLSTHYRRPIDFSETRIEEVGTGLEQFYRFFKRFERVAGQSFYELRAATSRGQGFQPEGDATLAEVLRLRERFLEAMDDDFNTGGAVGDLFELVRTLNKYVDEQRLEGPGRASEATLAVLRRGATTLRELGLTLGLFRQPVQAPAAPDDKLLGDLMKLLIDLRAEARGKKDFATADRIRRSLTELGVTLEDRPGGTDWTKTQG